MKKKNNKKTKKKQNKTELSIDELIKLGKKENIVRLSHRSIIIKNTNK